MVSSKDNKFVDYGGTVLGVGSLLVCFLFYPAVVFAAYGGRWFAENFFIEYLYENVILVQAGFLVFGISVISALLSLARQAKICYVFLAILYVVTFLPALKLLMWCYE